MIHINTNHIQLELLRPYVKKQGANRHFQRIYAELRYLCTLSDAAGGAHDELILQAAALLAKAADSHEFVTAADVEQAEDLLSPLAQEAKSYEYLCVAHAHIDMVWMWGYQETVGATLDTIRTMLDLMDEYPDFVFSQSQASIYRIAEQYAPELFRQIVERVRQGRWEITASSWVEADKNMSCAESLSRHILYTKQYMKDKFGMDPSELKIDFEPDTFGHSANVPEILRQGGVEYYYHCRGHVGDKLLYRWEAPSGQYVVLYTEPFWYNSDLNDTLADYATELARITGSRKLLRVYGVGDHGGGPTRRDLDHLIAMNRWPLYPKFTFSTLRAYFDSVSHLKDRLPVLQGEINYVCDGCYTTQARIKAGNRNAQRLLREAEYYSLAAEKICGVEYPSANLRDGWIRVLFNQFHDIITGSGVPETREYACGSYQEVFASAESARKIAQLAIADRVDTQSMLSAPQDTALTRGQGAGAGSPQCSRAAGLERVFVLFNPSFFARKDMVEVTLWDYEGDIAQISVRDASGRSLPCQHCGSGEYWCHHYDKFLVQAELPAGGYTSIVFYEKPDYTQATSFKAWNNAMRDQVPDRFVLENEYLRVELNPENGGIASFYSKEASVELANQGRSCGIFRLAMESAHKGITDWNTGMSAWFLGRFTQITDLGSRAEIVPVAQGPLRTAYRVSFGFGNSSRAVAVISLDAGARELRYDLDCDWREYGDGEAGIPNLHFYFPAAYPVQRCRCDVPGGIITREPVAMDIPAETLLIAENESGPAALALLSMDKYGFRCTDDAVSLTLLRGATDPDETPDIGRHHIQFAVACVPSSVKNAELAALSERYTHTASVQSVRPKAGTLPVEKSLVEVLSGAVAISCVKRPEEKSGLLLRITELNGEHNQVKIQLGFAARSAQLCSLLEQPCEGACTLSEDGRVLTLDARPYGITTVLLGGINGL